MVRRQRGRGQRSQIADLDSILGGKKSWMGPRTPLPDPPEGLWDPYEPLGTERPPKRGVTYKLPGKTLKAPSFSLPPDGIRGEELYFLIVHSTNQTRMEWTETKN